MPTVIANDICVNCGASEGLHHYETRQCPKNGREEYRDGKKQEWESTVFEDSGIKHYNDKAIKYHAPLTDIARRVVFMFSNEANYPEGTIGYKFAKDAQELLNEIYN